MNQRFYSLLHAVHPIFCCMSITLEVLHSDHWYKQLHHTGTIIFKDNSTYLVAAVLPRKKKIKKIITIIISQLHLEFSSNIYCRSISLTQFSPRHKIRNSVQTCDWCTFNNHTIKIKKKLNFIDNFVHCC